MTYCPECQLTACTLEDEEDVSKYYDQQETAYRRFYLCQDCGCEFHVDEVTYWVTEVEKHGKEFGSGLDADDMVEAEPGEVP